MVFNIGFGRSVGKQKQMVTTDISQQQTQKQQTSSTGHGVTTTLDPQTIATLQGVIQQLAPNVGQSADADLIRSLSGQLATNLDPALVEANIQAAQSAAIRNFDLNQGAQIRSLAQQVGSTGNGFVQGVMTQGNVDLSTMLAQLDAQTRLGAAGQRSADLSGAIQGIGAASQVGQQPLNQLLSAIATLTGARTEQNTSEQSLNDLIATMQQHSTEFTRGKTIQRGSEVGFGI